MRTFKTYYPDEFPAIIKKITVVSVDSPSPLVTPIPCFADGLPGIYFHESGHDLVLKKNGKKLSSLFLYGQTVNPVSMDMVSPFSVIIVHLYPPGIRSLFGMDAQELTDSCIDYSFLPGKDSRDLKNRLLETDTIRTKIRLLTDALQKRVSEEQPSLRDEIHYATQCLSMENDISLHSLRKELNISERTFQRKFLQRVGVTPSRFRRICKFRAALNRIESNAYEKLSDIAYGLDFSDQSHFNRIFKEFTGLTPGDYITFYKSGNHSF